MQQAKSDKPCIITLGRVIWRSRLAKGISQREFCKLIGEFNVQMDYMEFSKIENDRINMGDSKYDSFIVAIAKIFQLDIEWLEIIRQQTEAGLKQISSPNLLCKLRIRHRFP